jgi:hypothetical protein
VTLKVKGLGSLSLPQVASGGPAEVPLFAGDVLLTPGLLWVASLGSNEDDEDEELVSAVAVGLHQRCRFRLGSQHC